MDKHFSRLHRLLNQVPFGQLRQILIESNKRQPVHVPEADRSGTCFRGLFESDIPPFSTLIEEMTEIDVLKEYGDILFNAGNSAVRVGFKDLACWLVWRASETSCEQAIRELRRYVGQPYNAGVEIIALRGLKYGKTVNIINGIQMLPISHLPNSSYKKGFEYRLSGPPRYLSDLEFVLNDFPAISNALIRNIRFVPKFLKDDELPGVLSASKDNVMFDICNLFSLIEDACPSPYFSWTHVLDSVPFASLIGIGSCRYYNEASNPPNYELKDTDIVRIKNVARLFFKLSPKNKEKYGNAIARFALAKGKGSLSSKALDLGIALEMVLMEKGDGGKEISYKFRTRAAWLLGKNPTERDHYFRLFRDIYQYRSEVGHTGRLTQNSDKVKARVSEGTKAASKIFIKLMNKPNISWDDLVLGN